MISTTNKKLVRKIETQYNVLDKPIKKITTMPEGDFVENFRYNTKGLISRYENSDGDIIEYEYDVRGNLIQEKRFQKYE